MSDADATRARHDVAAEVDEILEHVINGNMLSMPYDVYLELFDAVDGLGVKIENLQSENAKLRELVLRFRNHTAKCTNYTYNFGYGDCALGPFPDGGGCGNCCHVMCGDMYRNDLDKQLRELGVEVTQ